ncbi:MAG: hypothetical protein JKY62_04150 [Desulfocapsa sp.]|nr:hypothetical protein [Desulfocapsa sp.]MBN4048553.1 hypothetical protein [bacterium AH-315-N22]
MKSLKFIVLILLLATPAAFSATIEESADWVDADQSAEISTANTTSTLLSGKAKKIRRPELTKSIVNAPTVMTNTAPMTTMTAPPSHSINCALAYNLNEDELYSDSISTVGEQHCYIMPLNQQSKVVGQLAATDPASDFNLYLYEYDSVQGFLNVIDGGEVPAGSVEATYGVLSTPSYILVAELMVGSGGSFNFLGNSYTNYDSYEPSDSPMTDEIPAITVGQTVTANLDNPSDVDYYAYTLKSTESQLKITSSGSPEHQVEAFINSSWVVLNHDSTYSLTGSLGSTMYFRALATPGTTPSALNNYQLKTSYLVSNITDISMWTTDNLTNLVWEAKNAHSNLGIGGTALDSSGDPVVGGSVVISVPIVDQWQTQVVLTNTLGRFSYSFDLPGCSGNPPLEKWSNYGSPATYWRIYYDLWNSQTSQIHVQPLNQPGNVINLNYAHICDEQVIGTR